MKAAAFKQQNEMAVIDVAPPKAGAGDGASHDLARGMVATHRVHDDGGRSRVAARGVIWHCAAPDQGPVGLAR